MARFLSPDSASLDLRKPKAPAAEAEPAAEGDDDDDEVGFATGGGDDDDDDDDDDDGGGGGGGLDGWSADMLRFLQGEEGGGKEGAGKDGGGEEGGEESGEEGGEEGGGFLCAFAWVVEPTVRCVGVAFYRHHPGVVRRTELARVAVARGEPVRAVPCRRLQPCVWQAASLCMMRGCNRMH